MTRPTARQRGYTTRWDKARKTFLAKNPLCAYCLREGITKVAQVVDHIVPHRGDQKLFWAQDNWQSLCSTCHNSVKQREENGQPAIGEDGWPVQ
jgi:5-methylcytosine-specific restriction endonuclease McrA